MRRKSDGVILIKDSSFTGCEPGVDTWKLQTSEISLDQAKGFATVKNARLDIGEVPVFYFPYAKFPISERRSSGLLFPSISNDQENGIDISQPIYWNFAPNYDATFTPRYIQYRGMGLEAKFRYLSSWSNNQLNMLDISVMIKAAGMTSRPMPIVGYTLIKVKIAMHSNLNIKAISQTLGHPILTSIK